VTDVVVIGGGVIGLAIARRLARAGAAVTLLERGTPGAEASSAAAGMLSPLAEAGQPGPFLDLLIRARSEYPAFCEELSSETGIDLGYRDEGTLMLALRDEDEAELEHRFGWQTQRGLNVERLTAEQARSAEPSITREVRWALRFPGDHQVENRNLARALWAAAAAAGVSLCLGAEAVRIHRKGGRARGVELVGGEVLAADTVILAGGSWSGRMEGLPRALPVEPVHGQLLALDALPPPIRHVVDSPRCYLVPRADGRLIVGATVERRGFTKSTTPSGMLHLLAGALEILPSLAELPIAETWSGLRPGTPDDLPILGGDPDLENLFYATGHFRNGILLTPITAEIVADLVLTGRSRVDLQPYRIDRFG